MGIAAKFQILGEINLFCWRFTWKLLIFALDGLAPQGK